MSLRDEKKSESLEVRLPYSQKIAFMEACKEEGITASEALRAGIDEFLATREGQSQQSSQFKDVVTLMKANPKKTVSSLIALSIGSALFATMPSAAQDELFAQYDKNKDGVLTVGEISENDGKVFDVLDKNKDGQITADEFQREAEVSQTLDAIEKDEDGNDVRIITYELTKVSLKEEGKAHVMVSRWAESVDMDATQADIDAKIAEMRSNTTIISDDDDFTRMVKLGRDIEDGKSETVIIKRMGDEDINLGEIEELLEFEGVDGGKAHKIIIRKSGAEGDVELESFGDIQKFLEEQGIEDTEGKKVIIRKEIVHEKTED